MADSPSLPRLLINVCGELSAEHEGRVSVLDRGFLHGDSVFETLRTLEGRALFLDPHLERLERSARGSYLELPLSRRGFGAEIDRSIREAPWEGECILRLIVSRGIGPLGLELEACRTPRWYIIVAELETDLLRASESPSPLRLTIDGAADDGSTSAGGRLAGRKTGNYLENVLARQRARQGGADDAVLLDANGEIAEATTANLFIVRDDVVRTPGEGAILAGITRRVLIEEVRRAGIDMREEGITVDELLAADEAFVSSSVRGLVPIGTVDGRAIGKGMRPLSERIRELYRRRAFDDVRSGPAD